MSTWDQGRPGESTRLLCVTGIASRSSPCPQNTGDKLRASNTLNARQLHPLVLRLRTPFRPLVWQGDALHRSAPAPKNDEAGKSNRGYYADWNDLSRPIDHVGIWPPVQYCTRLAPSFHSCPELGYDRGRSRWREEEMAPARVSVSMTVRPTGDGEPRREEEKPSQRNHADAEHHQL